MPHFLCFGDSITQGFNDPEGGWPERLRRKLAAAHPSDYIALFNLGISGNRSGDVAKRFANETDARIDPDEETFFFFDVGSNDAAIIEEKTTWTSLQDYEHTIRALLRDASSVSRNIIILGLTPVDETKTCPVLWRSTIAYKNMEIRQFDAVLRRLASEVDAPFVDMQKIFMTRPDFANLFSDGLHPAGDGHQLIADAVYHALEQLIKKKSEASR